MISWREKKLGNKVIQTFNYDQKMVPVPIFTNAFNHFCQIINLMKKTNQITKGRGCWEEQAKEGVKCIIACLFSICK